LLWSKQIGNAIVKKRIHGRRKCLPFTSLGAHTIQMRSHLFHARTLSWMARFHIRNDWEKTHQKSTQQKYKGIYNHRYAYLLGLLAMIKCSICSYQCDNWYISNWRFDLSH